MSFRNNKTNNPRIELLNYNAGVPFTTNIVDDKEGEKLAYRYDDVPCTLLGDTSNMNVGAVLYVNEKHELKNTAHEIVARIDEPSISEMVDNFFSVQSQFSGMRVKYSGCTKDKLICNIGFYIDKSKAPKTHNLTVNRCKSCGKEGVNLKLNARGLCKECASKVKDAPRSGQIVISSGGVYASDQYEAIGHEDEEIACKFFIDRLVEKGKDRSLLSIEHRAADYTSLVYDNNNDFLRIKITDRVKWLSIALVEEDRKKYIDDTLFYAQENKQQRHWRSNFESGLDLPKYVDLVENACAPTSILPSRDVSVNEKVIADYLYDLFLDCGAASGDMFYNTLSNAFELIYKCGAGDIRFKAYAKKPGGYLIADRDYDLTSIKVDGNKIPFSNLSELDCLKEDLIPAKIQRGREMMKYYTDIDYMPYVKY